jgi:hypothetical protein
MCAVCPTCDILLYFTTLLLFSRSYKLGSSKYKEKINMLLLIAKLITYATAWFSGL